MEILKSNSWYIFRHPVSVVDEKINAPFGIYVCVCVCLCLCVSMYEYVCLFVCKLFTVTHLLWPDFCCSVKWLSQLVGSCVYYLGTRWLCCLESSPVLYKIEPWLRKNVTGGVMWSFIAWSQIWFTFCPRNVTGCLRLLLPHIPSHEVLKPHAKNSLPTQVAFVSNFLTATT